MLAELVNDSLVHAMSADLGVGSELPEAQAEAISKIGKAIMERVTLELLKALPLMRTGIPRSSGERRYTKI